jgi:hypothetical protein
VERGFGTAQDRLVKGMRVAGVSTLEQANQYLDEKFIPWWDQTLTVVAANLDNAHRPLDGRHDLAAILSRVESRQVGNDYTLRFEGGVYQVERKDICAGLRGADVRMEKRLDGSLAVRFRDRYLSVSVCALRPKQAQTKPAARPRVASKPRKRSDWNQNFDLKKAPKVWQAADRSGARSQGPQW